MKCSYPHIFPVVSIILFSVFAKAQNSYTLQTALQTARENNPQLKIEHFNMAIAEADIISAKIRPNFNLSNESIQLLQTSEFAPKTSWHNNHNRQVMWQISKPIQIAGQRKKKIAVADKNLLYTKSEYRETERQLFLEVAEKWLSVQAVQKQLKIVELAKSNVDSLTLINQHRYSNQVVTETDLYRTELLSKQYEMKYNTILQEWNNLKKELGFLIGNHQSVEIDMDDIFFINIDVDLDSLITQALNNRSDILATKQLVEVSNSNSKLQKSLSYPQPEIGLIWNPQNHIPYAGISFSIDLPFSDRNQGEIKKSYLLKQQAEQQLFSIENQLQTEIETAYNSYLQHRQNSNEFEIILETSQTILDNVKYAYLKGGTTIIDFLEAQRAWLETQEQYYETLEQYYQSYVQLLYTTGLINQLAL